MDRVDFPDLDGAGSLWNPAGGSSTVVGAPFYSGPYDYNALALTPGVQPATVFDNAGNSSNVPFDIEQDFTPPATGTASYVNGYLTTPNADSHLHHRHRCRVGHRSLAGAAHLSYLGRRRLWRLRSLG